MDKKYFETRKGSLEDKINNIASEQPTINATYKPDVKLSTEKNTLKLNQVHLQTQLLKS